MLKSSNIKILSYIEEYESNRFCFIIGVLLAFPYTQYLKI